eukprot:766828-Pleurochrysis_carterae.AAC.4
MHVILRTRSPPRRARADHRTCSGGRTDRPARQYSETTRPLRGRVLRSGWPPAGQIKATTCQHLQQMAVSINVEGTRLSVYISFCALICIGIVLTVRFISADVQGQDILTLVFGYSWLVPIIAIRIYFGNVLAAYVLSSTWTLVLLVMLTDAVVHVLQAGQHLHNGWLSRQVYYSLVCCRIVEVCSLMAFSTIFQVTDEMLSQPDIRTQILPFGMLQVAMVMLSAATSMHGLCSKYWAEIKVPSFVYSAAQFHSVVLMAVSTFKLAQSLNAVLGKCVEEQSSKCVLWTGQWWSQPPSYIVTAKLIDACFMISVIVVPMSLPTYLLSIRSNFLETLELRISSSAMGQTGHTSGNAGLQQLL